VARVTCFPDQKTNCEALFGTDFSILNRAIRQSDVLAHTPHDAHCALSRQSVSPVPHRRIECSTNKGRAFGQSSVVRRAWQQNNLLVAYNPCIPAKICEGTQRQPRRIPADAGHSPSKASRARWLTPFTAPDESSVLCKETGSGVVEGRHN